MSAARFPFRTASRLGYPLSLPVTICQDIPTLLKFDEAGFTYDIDRPDFVRYFEGRTGLMISRVSALLNRHSAAPDLVARILQARLQDAWEIHRFGLEPEAGEAATETVKPKPAPLQLAFDF
jgi:hypothetical protein